MSFTMQKFWTFKDKEVGDLRKQLFFYLIVILVNSVLNAFFVYLLVEYTGIWYMLSQIISGLVIAVESFFIYKFLIFRRVCVTLPNITTTNSNVEEKIKIFYDILNFKKLIL